jgi:hypothetical protein
MVVTSSLGKETPASATEVGELSVVFDMVFLLEKLQGSKV